MMSLSDSLAFWAMFGFGPIPIWHLTLHSFLPSWKRRPGRFYAVCAAQWAFVAPLSLQLARSSDTVFEPSLGLRRICLAVSVLTFVVAVWSIRTLTPARFFMWSVLRPDQSKPVLIHSGPYRYLRHPAYAAIILTVAAAFLASGKLIVLQAFVAIAMLLLMVIGLEQRELESRLGAPAPELQSAPQVGLGTSSPAGE
jgi:protein-S-isoprenylcysteine O-methyltransferase Ste14